MSVAVDVPRVAEKLPSLSELWLTMNNASLANDPQVEIFKPDRRYYTIKEVAAYKDWKRQDCWEKRILPLMSLRQRLTAQDRERRARWAEEERLAFWWVGRTLWCPACKAGSKLELGDRDHPNWIPSEDPKTVKFFCLRCRQMLVANVDEPERRPSETWSGEPLINNWAAAMRLTPRWPF